MLRWLRGITSAAGIPSKSVNLVLVGCLFFIGLCGALFYEQTQVVAFSISLSVILATFILEFFMIRAKSRRRAISTVWPEVLDSMSSATSAGLSLFESFVDLAETGPVLLRPYFQKLESDVDSGMELVSALELLKKDLSQLHVDRLVELVRIVYLSGSQGFNAALRDQARQVREDIALMGEIESRQGWVAGTAKIAILAPWLIVAMLCSRQENVQAYSSSQGSLILLTGLIVSVFAYRLVQLLGSVRQPPRVFAS